MPKGISSRKKKQICVNGHEISIVGRDKSGWCNECKIEYYKIYSKKYREEHKEEIQEGQEIYFKQVREISKELGVRVCSRCGVEKQFEDFYPNSNSSYCKMCSEKYKKELRDSNPEKTMLKDKKNHFKKRYGITIEDYNKMFEEQNGKCAICEKPQKEFKKALAVDHNHITGKVRGLLCTFCNAYVVAILENFPNLLVKGKEYLEKNSEVLI